MILKIFKLGICVNSSITIAKDFYSAYEFQIPFMNIYWKIEKLLTPNLKKSLNSKVLISNLGV